jgi:periplasmic protein TonB
MATSLFAYDHSRQRLYFTGPLSVLINAIVFSLFAYSLQQYLKEVHAPPPLTVELAEVKPEPPKPVAPVKKMEPILKPEPAKLAPVETPVPAPVQPPAPVMTALPQPSAPPARFTVPVPVALPVEPAKSTAKNSARIENRGAQAIVHPYPVIPDELREAAMQESATARFHIHADGSVEVELIKPTQNLRLNRLLLETLRKWKFFPALKEGAPVDSMQDLTIKTEVN